MNKRGNLFEMLLLERGFPSWNESLNLSRREKGELSRARVFRKKLWPTFAAKVLRDTSLRDPSFIVRFTPVEAFFFPPNSFLFVYRDLKLIVFLPSYVLFFFFFFFNCRLVARCVFHGRTIIRFLIELSRRRLIFEICREFSKCFEYDRDNKRSDSTSNLWFLIWKCRGITMR